MEFLCFAFLIFLAVLVVKSMSGQQNVSNFKIEGVLYTEYIGTSSCETVSKTKTNTGSMVGRSIVGGALFGPVGAVLGGATAKKKTKTTTQPNNNVTFLVFFENGSVTEDTVAKGTQKYMFYMSKLKR